jgi:hypothetical protein
MALTLFSNVCPDGCSVDFEYPALDTDQNCPGDLNLSQVTDWWIKPNEAADTQVPFENWVDGGYTVLANPDSIDNTDTTNAKVKWLTAIGEVPASEKTVFTVQKFQKVTIKRVFTLTLTIYNLSNLQYEFLRALQCNPTNYTFWYGNSAHVYGKATGIIPTFTDVDFPLGAGEGDVELATVTITWESKTDPERKSNPYSDSDSVS